MLPRRGGCFLQLLLGHREGPSATVPFTRGRKGELAQPIQGAPCVSWGAAARRSEGRGPQRQENIWHGDLWVGLLAHASPSPVSLLRVSLKSGCKVTEGGLTCLPDVS